MAQTRAKTSTTQPNTALPIAIPPLFAWQQEVRSSKARYRVVNAARQVGKTHLAILECLEDAMNGGDVWWIAPDYSLTEPGYDLLKRIVDQPPFNQTLPGGKMKMVEEYVQRKLFTVRNGNNVGTIQIKSADDPQKLRGKTLTLAVLDEFAFMNPDAWYDGVSHALTVRRGRALFISTPYGKNTFEALHRLGNPNNLEYNPEWQSFTFDQHANPFISDAEIEEKRKTMPFRKFEREVLALFKDDGGEVFVGVNRAATVDPNPIPPRAPIAGHKYYFGMDISPGRNDYSVIMVLDKTDMQFVAMYRFSKPELVDQLHVLRAAYDYWKPETILVEENNAGLFAPGFFQSNGLPVEAFNTNWQTKRPLIEAYAAAIELGGIKLLRDADVIKEHEAMESDVTLSGQVRYNAPRGGHDDIVLASAIAYHAATQQATKPAPPIYIAQHKLYNRAQPRRRTV